MPEDFGQASVRLSFLQSHDGALKERAVPAAEGEPCGAPRVGAALGGI